MRVDWAQQPISQVATSRYTLIQFITALQQSLQLGEEISRPKAPHTHYGQYTKNPRSMGYPNSHARYRDNN